MSFPSPEAFKAYYTDAKVAELQAAFNLVAPAGNWKTAIDATVIATVDEIAVIREAVTFYTGSEARVEVVKVLEVNGGKSLLRVRIRAAGYYAAIGA